jgi:hypothetical protein
MMNSVGALLAKASPKAHAFLLYHFRKASHFPFGTEYGGAFNSQRERQTIFHEIVRAYPPSAILETGSFRGVTTEFMAKLELAPIYSCEAIESNHCFSQIRLRGYPKVKLSLLDSRTFLKNMIAGQNLRRSKIFAYLDAHWENDLPLHDEVRLIADGLDDYVIMVDDFDVPGDAGYTFDDYGPGKKLTLSYLQDLVLSRRLTVYFPSAHSSAESGAKRGSVILASPSAAAALDGLKSLRRHA